jgi:hypothetical protein
VPREPDGGYTFNPIGHIAVDLRPEENERLGQPAVGPVWIAGLYISYALQGKGLGKQAMLAAEAIAASPPLNGTSVILDTMAADQQMQPAFLKRVFTDQGNPAPTVRAPPAVPPRPIISEFVPGCH